MFQKRFWQEWHKGCLRTKALDESGAALVIALMVLVILSLLGTSAIITSVTEVEIAGNERQYQMAFYASDGGSDMGPRIIRDSISFYDEPAYTDTGVLVRDGFLDELMNLKKADGKRTDDNDGPEDNPLNNPDIQIPAFSPSLKVEIDVDREKTIELPGGAREMGSGYEGIGGGSGGGGTGIMYKIESRSEGPRNSSSTIHYQYLYVIGVGG